MAAIIKGRKTAERVLTVSWCKFTDIIRPEDTHKIEDTKIDLF